jgi:hypothetical protein
LRAAIIQTRAFLISEKKSNIALASICISCCTTGFAAATMWYDFDTSPGKRKECPRLCGATPDQGRGLFFFLVTVSGALQVLAKSLSSALLLIANPNWFVAYTAVDHVLFQFYLVLRGDHRTMVPGLGVVMSSVIRIFLKLVADYTSCWGMM